MSFEIRINRDERIISIKVCSFMLYITYMLLIFIDCIYLFINIYFTFYFLFFIQVYTYFIFILFILIHVLYIFLFYFFYYITIYYIN